MNEILDGDVEGPDYSSNDFYLLTKNFQVLDWARIGIHSFHIDKEAIFLVHWAIASSNMLTCQTCVPKPISSVKPIINE